MRSYLADTNVLIRYLLRDNPSQVLLLDKYISNAQRGKIKIIIASEVIPEIEYVLRKVYRIVKIEIIKKLSIILKTTYFDIEKRTEWLGALGYYSNFNIDLIDSFIFTLAVKKNVDILTFDKDYKKIRVLN